MRFTRALPLLCAALLQATSVLADGRFIVFYTDAPPGALPSVSDLQGFNTVYLGFWNRGGAYSGNPLFTYQGLSESDRAARKAEFASAGILQMISAFGEGFTLTGAEDPTAIATELATWVTTYGVDGVDIDFEDITSGTTWSQKAAWMITFQQTLRGLLPASTYYISHSPLPTFFAGSASEQFYSQVDKAVGSGISWYNMQYYNQNDVYSSCPSLLTVASDSPIYTGTSVQELSRSSSSSQGIPLSKIQITKPAHPSDTNAGGYLTPDTMASCIREARGFGWTGGVTLFKYGPDADLKTYITAVRAAYGSPKRNVAIEAPGVAVPAAHRVKSGAGGASAGTGRQGVKSSSQVGSGSGTSATKTIGDEDEDTPRHGRHSSSSSHCGDDDHLEDGDDRSRDGRRDLRSGLAFEGVGGMGGRMVMVRRGRDYRMGGREFTMTKRRKSGRERCD